MGILDGINAMTIYGYTPLHYAVIGKHPKCVGLLLELGGNHIDVNAANDEGNTPLHLAAYFSANGKILKHLLASEESIAS